MLSFVSLRQRAPALDPRALAAGVVAWCIGALISFRFVIASSFDLMFGDRRNGRLIIYLHEHLFRALAGRADFLSPPFFYPQKYVLGFSDAFLLDTPPYAALRLIGFDPFLSFQIWAMVLSFLCFLASLVICMRYLRLRVTLAICAAALITFPNNLMFKMDLAHLHFSPSITFLPSRCWGFGASRIFRGSRRGRSRASAWPRCYSASCLRPPTMSRGCSC